MKPEKYQRPTVTTTPAPNPMPIVAFTVVKQAGLYQPYRLTIEGDRVTKREKIGTETMRQFALAKVEAEMER